MATVGELYSFSEEFIENAVIKVVDENTLLPISGLNITISFTGYGESNISSTTDSDGLSDFFLVDVNSGSSITVTIDGSPIQYEFNHQGGNLELFTVESIVTNSEVLNANIDDDCANQEYYLTWINSLGGYEFWKFTARASKGLNSISKNIFNKDVFQNWDDEFINGKRDRVVLENKWREKITLRTQLLNEDQATSLSKIPLSNSVFLIDGTKEIPVVIESGSFDFFTDRQKITELQFNITFPERYSQTS